ncbi:hypothetical protein DFJ73DRAFT_917849 [Zopfochytrium polystomum]|nr:hypothetical protein DFJ73DRAFT_917849 [Zopfochytrium polystomum]
MRSLTAVATRIGLRPTPRVGGHRAPTVKAFNNIFFKHLENLARPKGHPERSALPIASDDVDAKAKVSEFVEDIGFDAVDVGSFADSWRSEPNTPVYVSPYFARPSEGLSEEEKAKWLFEGHGGSVVRAADVKALLGKATKDSPVGGVLPKSSQLWERVKYITFCDTNPFAICREHRGALFVFRSKGQNAQEILLRL